jgi:ribose 5-phosphate isomerase RpiB
MSELSPKPRVTLGADHTGFPNKETIRQFLENAEYLVDLGTARLAREHNDANVLALGGRVVSGSQAMEMAQTFLNTAFVGGRHARRVEKITIIEQDERKNN